VFFLVFLLFTCAFPKPAAFSDNEGLSEYEVKSGLLYRICKFTRWPQFPPPGQPFIISILGKMPPGQTIAIPSRITICRRKIVVRQIMRLSEINGSHVLFIASSEAHRVDDILDCIGGQPILTAGDSKGFSRKGVIVNFYLHKSLVRFEINREACEKASLKMHSHLFTIARAVKEKNRETTK
jgi:hypothetical protein